MLWYSLEAPHGGASNEDHNICFCAELKISILLGWGKKKHLIWSYAGLLCLLFGYFVIPSSVVGDVVKSLGGSSWICRVLNLASFLSVFTFVTLKKTRKCHWKFKRD